MPDLTLNLTTYQTAVDEALTQMQQDNVVGRIWNHDHTIRNNVIAYNCDLQTGGWFDVSDASHWPKAMQAGKMGGTKSFRLATIGNFHPADIRAFLEAFRETLRVMGVELALSAG